MWNWPGQCRVRLFKGQLKDGAKCAFEGTHNYGWNQSFLAPCYTGSDPLSLMCSPYRRETIIPMYLVHPHPPPDPPPPTPTPCIAESTVASQITSLPIVYLTVNSGADQRKHHSSTQQAIIWTNAGLVWWRIYASLSNELFNYNIII